MHIITYQWTRPLLRSARLIYSYKYIISNILTHEEFYTKSSQCCDIHGMQFDLLVCCALLVYIYSMHTLREDRHCNRCVYIYILIHIDDQSQQPNQSQNLQALRYVHIQLIYVHEDMYVCCNLRYGVGILDLFTVYLYRNN